MPLARTEQTLFRSSATVLVLKATVFARATRTLNEPCVELYATWSSQNTGSRATSTRPKYGLCVCNFALGFSRSSATCVSSSSKRRIAVSKSDTKRRLFWSFDERGFSSIRRQHSPTILDAAFVGAHELFPSRPCVQTVHRRGSRRVQDGSHRNPVVMLESGRTVPTPIFGTGLRISTSLATGTKS